MRVGCETASSPRIYSIGVQVANSTREHFTSRNGISVKIISEGSDKLRNRDGRGHYYQVFDPAQRRERVCVQLMALPLLALALKQEGLPELSTIESRLALVALLQNLDAVDNLRSDAHGNRILEFQPGDAIRVLKPAKLSDRQLRRFIVRRVYDEVTRSDLNNWFLLDDLDMAECGAAVNDFMRAAQVLEEDGYLKTDEPAANGFHVLPKAKLIRDVERYGAAKDDVVSERGYMASLESYKALAPQLPTIRLEYQRYGSATTETELLSVFKAVGPLVGSVAKDLVRASGGTKEITTLGPAISEMQSRRIGDAVLWAELTHVLKFTRDLTSHGASLSEPVLRIANENAFEVVLKLAALFPR